jgi:hypothetical protein
VTFFCGLKSKIIAHNSISKTYICIMDRKSFL